MLNNPIKYTDPSGHLYEGPDRERDRQDQASEESADPLAGEGTAGDDGGSLGSFGEFNFGPDFRGAFGFTPEEKVSLDAADGNYDGKFFGRDLGFGGDFAGGKGETGISAGYLDINLNIGFIVGVTLGVVIAPNGNVYAYVGPSISFPPGVSGAISISPNAISSGWNFGVAGSLGLFLQGGVDSTMKGYFEVGAALPPGLGLSEFYIFETPIMNLNENSRRAFQSLPH